MTLLFSLLISLIGFQICLLFFYAEFGSSDLWIIAGFGSLGDGVPLVLFCPINVIYIMYLMDVLAAVAFCLNIVLAL